MEQMETMETRERTGTQAAGHDFIEVSHLKRYFPIRRGVFSRVSGYVRAVDDVSFSIRKGEILGLVGESGCGKSTTGKTMLCLQEATGGSMRYDGTTVFDVEKGVATRGQEMQRLRRSMQIIFQDPYASLDPRKTIGYIVTEGILKHKLAASRREALEQAKEMLERCGIPANSVQKYPHEFSGGQRQRIGIARSLVLRPSFIVGDEPLAALDASIQSQVLTLLQDLVESFHLTTLFISHDLGVVKYFCDRIAVMYLGSLVEIGTSEQVFGNPQHPYTQALISAIPAPMPGRAGKRIILAGDIPSPANPPSGCKFHTRCPYARPECSEAAPEQRTMDGGHAVWCHLCRGE